MRKSEPSSAPNLGGSRKAASTHLVDLAQAPRLRVDKWRWFARFCKTRSLASRVVEDGALRINGVLARKPSQLVTRGDVLTLALHGQVRLLRVLDCAERRGPAPEAQKLYALLSPSGEELVAMEIGGAQALE